MIKAVWYDYWYLSIVETESTKLSAGKLKLSGRTIKTFRPHEVFNSVYYEPEMRIMFVPASIVLLDWRRRTLPPGAGVEEVVGRGAGPPAHQGHQGDRETQHRGHHEPFNQSRWLQGGRGEVKESIVILFTGGGMIQMERYILICVALRKEMTLLIIKVRPLFHLFRHKQI